MRFWEKLCEFLCQTIIWTKKQQESRNIPKNRQSNIILRYPFFYSGFTKICSEVECFFLGSAQFNMYSLGKNKQKLVVVSLMQLGTAYHVQVNKSIRKVKSIVFEQKKDEQDGLLKQFIKSISMIFEQVSCQPVYHSVLNSLCKQLKQISAEVYLNRQKDSNYQHYANILNEIKTELKKVLVLHGANYGISSKQLQAFQILSI